MARRALIELTRELTRHARPLSLEQLYIGSKGELYVLEGILRPVVGEALDEAATREIIGASASPLRSALHTALRWIPASVALGLVHHHAAEGHPAACSIFGGVFVVLAIAGTLPASINVRRFIPTISLGGKRDVTLLTGIQFTNR